MEESSGSCVERRQEPDTETVELLKLIEKYPGVILTLLVSLHLQECTYSDNKMLYSKFHVYGLNLKLNSNIHIS